MNDLEKFKITYKYDINKFITTEKKFSGIFTTLYECSSKMLSIILNIMHSTGPIIVYSNYVFMEGLQIFKIYLRYCGFFYYKDNDTKKNFNYAEFTGNTDINIKNELRPILNNSNNKFGEYIKILLISPSGTEGLNFIRNVRQVHIMEPNWNEVRITQLIGRAIRRCFHKDLPLEERYVDIYRYHSIKADKQMTTDTYIFEMAKSKDNLIKSFTDAIKEVAIDCNLNKEHNMINESYKCFQFNQESLFEKQIGPAYKAHIEDDLLLNNGLNSKNTIIKKIKAYKIKAVINLSKNNNIENPVLPRDPSHLSKDTKPVDPDLASDGSPLFKGNTNETKDYWYDPNTNIVYDIDLFYPIGKIYVDNNNIPKKLDTSTFIINYVLPIPLL